MSETWSVILAAGKGKRMRSRRPKVVHKICGLPLVEHVLRAAATATDRQIVVLGHGGQSVQEALGDSCLYAVQERQLGTGDALKSAAHLLPPSGDVMVLCGDTPLMEGETLQQMLSEHRRLKAGATVLTFRPPDAGSYGRVIRNQSGQVERIVEAGDATADELAVNEVNSGSYCFDITALKAVLPRLTTANAQGEFYLTDAIYELRKEGMMIAAFEIEDYRSALGVNSRSDLADAAFLMRKRVNRRLMDAGVTLMDPGSVYADVDVKVGMDTVIYPQTFLEGKTTVGNNCVLGPGCHLTDTTVGDDCSLHYVTAVQAVIGNSCQAGPYVYLRPGAVLDDKVKVGDFVEIKNSRIGRESKIPHLSYVGDAEIGRNVNMGAGTIVVNYNGRLKQVTKVKDGAFVGCNSNLIAPVEIGEGAYVAAGSTVTKDVPAEALAVERAEQVNKPGLAARFLKPSGQQENTTLKENK